MINIGRRERTLVLGKNFTYFYPSRSDFFRIFDINSDGFISKEEFGWMTSSKIIGIKEIEGVFQVELELYLLNS